MATAAQLKSLIRSHFAGETEHFRTLALQVAAHEARRGHPTLAHDIRELVDAAARDSVRVIPFRPDLHDLVLTSSPRGRLSHLVAPPRLRGRLQRIVLEFQRQNTLRRHGLDNRRKALLAGPPGTGKTMTAGVLAGELQLPLHTILMDKLVTRFMGETSAKLRQIFEVINDHRAVFFFDEFDAIGGARARENDVGEMRRVLNSFLQFIEQDRSDSLIVAATNNPRILDHALFRRFDDVLHYRLPGRDDIAQLLRNRLAAFTPPQFPFDHVVGAAAGLSHAEITQSCDDAVKDAILDGRRTITRAALETMLEERRHAYPAGAE